MPKSQGTSNQHYSFLWGEKNHKFTSSDPDSLTGFKNLKIFSIFISTFTEEQQ